MPKVIVSGVTSCENRGVEALVTSIAFGLRDCGGACRMTVLTQTPDHDRALAPGDGIEWVADPFVLSRSWSHARPAEPPSQAAERAHALLASADLVLTTGGDLHTSAYGVSTSYLAAPSAALDKGVPVAMIAHSIGPFTDAGERRAFTAAARRSAILTVREQASLDYATTSLGLEGSVVSLTADPAFLLPAAPPGRVDQILASSGIGPDQPYLCLAPSRGIAGFRQLDHASHLAALLRLTGELRRKWGLPIVAIPHVHDSRPANDDRRLVAELAAAAAGGLRPLSGGLTAAEYKGVVSRSALLIAERLHAAIAGLSSAVPTVAIGYSPKFAGVLAGAYGPAISPEDVHIDVRAFVSDEAAARRLLGNLDIEDLRRHLRERLPLVLGRARENFALAWQAMGGTR
ncbi:MAG TPA: polysaccharide pyruvyl transferase family protein [Streptosporangiaceae bacterium]|nr:polysaccharide pyruvyl transferase family protein [Streptosporangiaceae bacterium]